MSRKSPKSSFSYTFRHFRDTFPYFYVTEDSYYKFPMAHSVLCRHAAIVTMEMRRGDRSIIVIARSTSDHYVIASRGSDPYVIARSGSDPYVIARRDSDHHVIARSRSDVAILLCNKSIKKIVVNPRNNIYLCRFAKDLTKFIQNLYNYDQKQFI